MIVTEEEAKTKRCQETFAANNNVSEDGSSFYVPVPTENPDERQTNFTHIPCAPKFCIGAACMAWRWQNDALSDYPPDTKGYCGKAGRP